MSLNLLRRDDGRLAYIHNHHTPIRGDRGDRAERRSHSNVWLQVTWRVITRHRRAFFLFLCIYTVALYIDKHAIADMQFVCRVSANALQVLTATVVTVLATVQVAQQHPIVCTVWPYQEQFCQ
jgi:hypothetical protein